MLWMLLNWGVKSLSPLLNLVSETILPPALMNSRLKKVTRPTE